MVITANLWVMLGITLLIGFIFGLFVSNAGKHKRRWREEVRLREKLEKERAVLIRDRDSAFAHRDARIAELEQKQAVATTASAPTPLIPGKDSAAEGRDRLSAITGIDPQDEIRLNEAGYYRYDQIASLSASDERALEDRLHRERGSIRDEQWRQQAKLLAAGNSKEHLERYGASHRVV
jgi:predicted flap endonuclease-1-like 5' DNA nuclease